MSASVAVVDTGIANSASVLLGLRRVGGAAALTSDPNTIREAEFVVLPGVGSFGAGMDRLCRMGVDAAITRRAAAGRPLLAICLGMQLLCVASDESPGDAGLGVAPVTVRPIAPGVRIPHLGWNSVTAPNGAPFDTGEAYFANSYCIRAAPTGWGATRTHYGVEFVSAMWRGATLGCQFHPELSGDWGLGVLESWLRSPSLGMEAVAC